MEKDLLKADAEISNFIEEKLLAQPPRKLRMEINSYGHPEFNVVIEHGEYSSTRTVEVTDPQADVTGIMRRIATGETTVTRLVERDGFITETDAASGRKFVVAIWRADAFDEEASEPEVRIEIRETPDGEVFDIALVPDMTKPLLGPDAKDEFRIQGRENSRIVIELPTGFDDAGAPVYEVGSMEPIKLREEFTTLQNAAADLIEKARSENRELTREEKTDNDTRFSRLEEIRKNLDPGKTTGLSAG